MKRTNCRALIIGLIFFFVNLPIALQAQPVPAQLERGIEASGIDHSYLGHGSNYEVGGLVTNTSEDSLILRKGFFRPLRFVYGEDEPKAVYDWTGLSFHSEFQEVMNQRPAALQIAKRAYPYNAVAAGGSAAMFIGSLRMLLGTINDAQSISSGETASYGVDGLGLMLAGGLTMAVASRLGHRHLTRGVQAYNDASNESTQAASTDDVTTTHGINSDTRPPGLESWYMYWALGWTNLGYPGELEDALDVLRGHPEVTNLALDLDLLGIYVPLPNHKTIVGGVINGAGDRYQVDDTWMQINQYLFSLSAMHFIDGQIGRGFFMRGDAGLARLVVNTPSGMDVSSESGYGILFGGGYGVPITQGTRLLINVNYAIKRIEGERYGKLNVSIGGLF